MIVTLIVIITVTIISVLTVVTALHDLPEYNLQWYLVSVIS